MDLFYRPFAISSNDFDNRANQIADCSVTLLAQQGSSAMNNLTVFADKLMERSNYTELLSTCAHAIERVSGLGPSDNDVKMIVRSVGQNQFVVNIRMASAALGFSLQAVSQNPIKAVESAMQAAVAKVNSWSAARADA